MCDLGVCDYRLILQGITLAIVSLAIVILVYSRIRFGRFANGMIGVLSLLVHVFVFYVSIYMREYGGFDLIGLINESFGEDIMSYGLWSSAIRLQTAILIMFMVLTVVRRQAWIKSIGE